MDIERRIEELRQFYPLLNLKPIAGGYTVVRVRNVALPAGCNPGSTDVLLTLSAGQEVPAGRFVKHPVVLPSGNSPSYSATLIDGETWYGFSYNFPWSSTADPMYVFVESMITRFAKPN